VESPNALRFAIKLVSNVFQDMEKLWNDLIEERGQFLNNEQQKSVEIDFISWSKRIFTKTTMLITASYHPYVLPTYYDRIKNKNLPKRSDEEFLDRLFIASD
ncbi:24349_t:CDS:1, partial [Gigaspora margarita]